MKKTIHGKSADNTRATNTGDGRIDAAKPSRRRAIKTLAATTALAATASSMSPKPSTFANITLVKHSPYKV